MPRRTALIMLAAAVLVGAGTLGVLLSRRTTTKNTGNETVSTGNENATSPTANVAPSPRAQDPELVQVIALAKNFTERYGSFSNENPFENLEDLLPWMAAALRTATEADLVKQKGQRRLDEDFFGVTTKALAPTVTAFAKGASATVDVATQRTEQRGVTMQPAYRQTLKLSLVVEDGAWKVSTAAWLPKVQE